MYVLALVLNLVVRKTSLSYAWVRADGSTVLNSNEEVETPLLLSVPSK